MTLRYEGGRLRGSFVECNIFVERDDLELKKVQGISCCGLEFYFANGGVANWLVDDLRVAGCCQQRQLEVPSSSHETFVCASFHLLFVGLNNKIFQDCQFIEILWEQKLGVLPDCAILWMPNRSLAFSQTEPSLWMLSNTAEGE